MEGQRERGMERWRGRPSEREREREGSVFNDVTRQFSKFARL